MIRSLAATLLLVLSFVVVPVLAEETAPSGLPPTMVIAKIGEEGSLEVRQTVIVPVQEKEVRKVPSTEFREEVVGGVTRKIPVVVEREVTVTVTRYVAEQRVSLFSKDNFHVLDLEGNKVEGDALTKAFEKPRKALLSAQPKQIDPFYAEFFKPDTLVIYQKATPAVAIPAPLDVPASPAIPAPRPIPAPKPRP